VKEALQTNLVSKEHHDTINSFFDKIHQATIEGSEWVETTPQIIHHYNKQGLGKAEYFIFQGIKVCPYGQSERLQKELSRQLGSVLYGDQEAKVNQIYGTTPKATG
jgi:hypothetical protein